jgi:hypothetical protein
MRKPPGARRISSPPACTMRKAASCCAATARARPPSPASSTTTPSSRRRCSICTKPASNGAIWNWPSGSPKTWLELVRRYRARRILQHGRGRSHAGHAHQGRLRRRGAFRQLHRRAEPAAARADHGRADFRASAARALDAFGSRMVAAPVGVPQMLVAYESAFRSPSRLSWWASATLRIQRRLLAALHSRFVPQPSCCWWMRSRGQALARFIPASRI